MTIDYSPGRWIVTNGYASDLIHASEFDIYQIRETTEKIVKCVPLRSANDSVRHLPKLKGIASFSDEDGAKRLVSTIAGIRGEMERRIAKSISNANSTLNAALRKLKG